MNGGEISRRHGGVHVHGALHPLQHLGAVSAAQGIGGEISDGPAGPVAVLQDAAPVIRHLQAKVIPHLLPPEGGQLRRVQAILDQKLFQLIAEQDMQAVGELIRLRADEGGPGDIHRPVQVLRRNARRLLREQLPQLGEKGAGKGPAPAQQVLKEAALALMDAHGDPGAQAGIRDVLPDMELIQGVPPLMDHAEQGAGGIIQVIVGGDAHVRWAEIRGEGMLRLPDAAVFPVNADESHEPVRELPLLFQGILPVEEGVVRLLPLLRDPMDQGDELLTKHGEKGVAVRHGQAPLEFIQKDVVGLLIRIQPGGVFPVEGHDLPHAGLEHGPVALLLGLVPYRVRLVQQNGVGIYSSMGIFFVFS